MRERTLFGRYNLIKILGQGGMGTVYLSERLTDKKLCAIKEIPVTKRGKEYILKEPRLLQRLDHPSIVKVIEIFEMEDKVFIVMDFVDGKTLREALTAERKFNEKRVINWAVQICKALEYLHNAEPYPIVYRDIKPSNIIIDKNDNITLIDFGIACEYGKDSKEDTLVALTKGYCAPEQYIDKTFDIRSDIYSLGITMYHLLTGVSPSDSYFETTPIKKYNENISREIEYIVTKATHIDPEERYQCIEDMLYDLENIEVLHKELKKIVFKQIKIYGIFAIFYLLFSVLIFIGYKSLKEESLTLSGQSIKMGAAELSDGNLNKAYDNFQDAIKLNPLSIEAYEATFEYFYKSLRYQDGVNYIKNHEKEFDVIDDMNRISNFYRGKFNYEQGNVYNESGKYREAKNNFKDVYNISPTYKENLFLLCLSIINLKEPLNDYENEFLSLSATNEEIHYINAKKNEIDNKLELAISEYDMVIEKSSNNELIAEAFISKAKIYKRNPNTFDNNNALYIMTLEEASKRLDNYRDLRLNLLKAEEYKDLAASSEAKGNENERIINTNLALDNYIKLINAGKDESDLYSEAYKLYVSLDEFHSAEQIALEGIKRYPNDFRLFYYLTIVQYKIEFEKPKDQRDYTIAKKSYEATKEIAFKESRLDSLKELEDIIEKYS